MNKCLKCKNPLERRVVGKKSEYLGMGIWKEKSIYGMICPYCIWKGNAGPGADLKKIIKEKNENR